MTTGGGVGPKAIRVAIAGSDDALQHHIAVWQRVPGAQIVAFSAGDRERLLQAVELAPGAAAFTSEESLLSSGLFSALDIYAQSAEHVTVVDSALRAGFDVLCRAPVSPDATPTGSFAALSLRRNQVYVPAQMLRFHPACEFLRDLIENDDLGGALRIEIGVGASDIPDAGDSSGAPVLAAIDLFAYLAGGVSQARTVVADGSGVVDAAAIAITSLSGAIGSILACSGQSPSGATITVSGSAALC